MKNCMRMIVLLLALALVTGCNQTQPAQPTTVPTTQAATEPTEAATTPTEATEDVPYEGDASSYYIDVVYAQQIAGYHTAISQLWDEAACAEHAISPLVANYYEGTPMDNVGFAFMDLDGDGIWELIIGATQEPLIFEIWALKNDAPELLVQSTAQNRYYLQYAEEDELWSVACEAEKSETNYGVYYLQLLEGKPEVTQGIVYDAGANEQEPWFMAYDLDWDVSNDSPVDADTAKAILEAGKKSYALQEYFPYSLYK